MQETPGALSISGVSVIVPSYEGRHVIGRCLTSLRTMSSPVRVKVEIVVVDSGTDGSAELVAREFPEVVLIHSETRLSAGAARNLGVAKSRFEILAFVDQDCAVPGDWLSRLLAHLEDQTVDGVGGSLANGDACNPSGTTLYFLEFMYHLPRKRSRTSEHLFLLACNAAYRRRVFQAVSYPDRTMAEDVLFSGRARESGFRCVYDPSISVSHRNKRGWRRIAAYLWNLGRASADFHGELDLARGRLVLDHPLLVFLVPLYILPTMAFRVLRTARPAYVARLLILFPTVVVGNVVWAAGFYREASRRRKLRATDGRT